MRGCVSIETQVNPSIPTNTEIDRSSGRKVLPLNDECYRYGLMTNKTALHRARFASEKSVSCSVRYKGEEHRREAHSPHVDLQP